MASAGRRSSSPRHAFLQGIRQARAGTTYRPIITCPSLTGSTHGRPLRNLPLWKRCRPRSTVRRLTIPRLASSTRGSLTRRRQRWRNRTQGPAISLRRRARAAALPSVALPTTNSGRQRSGFGFADTHKVRSSSPIIIVVMLSSLAIALHCRLRLFHSPWTAQLPLARHSLFCISWTGNLRVYSPLPVAPSHALLSVLPCHSNPLSPSVLCPLPRWRPSCVKYFRILHS